MCVCVCVCVCVGVCVRARARASLFFACCVRLVLCPFGGSAVNSQLPRKWHGVRSAVPSDVSVSLPQGLIYTASTLVGARTDLLYRHCYRYGRRHTVCEKGTFFVDTVVVPELDREMSLQAVPGVALNNLPGLRVKFQEMPIVTRVLPSVEGVQLHGAPVANTQSTSQAWQRLQFPKSTLPGNPEIPLPPSPRMHQKVRGLGGGPRGGWTSGRRRLPKRLGAVTVGYECGSGWA